jgi:hypothetical protein
MQTVVGIKTTNRAKEARFSRTHRFKFKNQREACR